MKKNTCLKAFLSVSAILALFIVSGCNKDKPSLDNSSSPSTNEPSLNNSNDTLSNTTPTTSNDSIDISSDESSEINSNTTSNNQTSNTSSNITPIDVNLINQDFIYDGNVKELKIEGDVPSNITYEINYYKVNNLDEKIKSPFEVGEYKVELVFSNGYKTNGSMNIIAPSTKYVLEDPLSKVLSGKYAISASMNGTTYFLPNNITTNATIKTSDCNSTTSIDSYSLLDNDFWEIIPVQDKTNVYYLKANNKYLSASASATSLKLDNNPYEWTLVESSKKGTYYLYNGTRGVLLNGSTAFGNYSTSNESKDEYGKLTFYYLGKENPKKIELKSELTDGTLIIDEDAPKLDNLYSCDEVRFKVIPNENKMVSSIKLNNNDVYYEVNENNEVICKLPKGSYGELEINFTTLTTKRNIIVSKDNNVTLGNLPTSTYETTPINVSLIPNEGYFIKDILLNDESIIDSYDEINNTLFFKTASGKDTTLTIISDKYYNISTSKIDNGEIILPTDTKIKANHKVEVQVVADNLYELDKVYINNVEVSYEIIEENNKYYTISLLINENSNITASFKEMEKVDISTILSDENNKEQYFYIEGELVGFNTTSIRLKDKNDKYVSIKLSATDKTNLEAKGITDGDIISVYFRYQGNANASLVDYIQNANDILMDESKLIWNAVGSSYDLYYLEEGEEDYVLVASNIPDNEYEFDDTLNNVSYSFKIITHSMYGKLDDKMSISTWNYGATYKLTYNNLGQGETIEEVTNLTKLPSRFPILYSSNYIFDGWYLKDGSLDNDYGEKATPNMIMSNNITLYAKWRSLSNEINETTNIKDYADSSSWSNSTKYTEVLIDNTCSLKASVSGGSNSGKYYTADFTWRLYQTENAKLKLSIETGTIVSIKINYSVGNTGTLVYNDENITSGTLINVNSNAIELNVGNTGTATNGQVKITSIEVTYSLGETGDINKIVSENYIKELLSYGDINKNNYENIKEVLNNVNSFISLYIENGGNSTSISNYSSYIEYKNSFKSYEDNKIDSLNHTNTSLNNLNAFIENEEINKDTKLTENQYNELYKLLDEANSNLNDYILNYGHSNNIVASNNLSLVDTLIENYINENNILITRNYIFDNEEKFDNYSKNWNSLYKERILTSGMYINDTPLVTMTYTNASIQSNVITNCPISKGGQINIITPDSIVNGINIKLLQYENLEKDVKVKFYNNDTYLDEISSSTFTNGVMLISYNEIPSNTNKVIIDLSNNNNLIGVSSIALNLSTKTNKMINSSYYASIEDTYKGETLWTKLNELTTSTHTYKSSYADCAYLAYLTDEDKNNPGNIVDFYSHLTINGTWDGGKTWNREHLWCQSKAWYGNITSSTINAGTDLHQLRPLYSTINGSRNNSQYGDLSKDEKYLKLYSSNGTWVPYGYLNTDTSLGTGTGVFEPLDNVKGDVARILMYLLVRYKEYTDTYSITNNVYTPNNTLEEVYTLLLKWNEIDPVDYMEIARNNAVYALQGNRNPFIDNPNYANLIWGD